MRTPLRSLFLIAATLPSVSAADTLPIKILLITGGCCHDYKIQKDILKTGLMERLNATVEQIHVNDGSTKPPLPIYGNPEYAKGYDLVIHDECAADISDPVVIQGVLKPHKEDGIPAVNLHCAMHSYRMGNYDKPVTAGDANAAWFEYLGLQSTGHGAHIPISIHFLDPADPITRGLADWTTIPEEDYNNVQILTGQALAKGTQRTPRRTKDADGKESATIVEDVTTVVVWTNLYTDKKIRVFSTSIGHNNQTVSDPKYLDLVSRGALWATNHLADDGAPAAGYGKAK